MLMGCPVQSRHGAPGSAGLREAAARFPPQVLCKSSPSEPCVSAIACSVASRNRILRFRLSSQALLLVQIVPFYPSSFRLGILVVAQLLRSRGLLTDRKGHHEGSWFQNAIPKIHMVEQCRERGDREMAAQGNEHMCR